VTDDWFRDTCEWCRIDVLNGVGPPHMAHVSGKAGPGPDTTEWKICLECYTLLIKFISNLQRVSSGRQFDYFDSEAADNA
jgi:hypothetical protein